MNKSDEQTKPAPFITVSIGQAIGVLAIGAIVGLITWGLTMPFEGYAFMRIVSVAVATGVGVFALVKLQIFRPLLVGIGPVVGLWGVADSLMAAPWQVAGLFYAGLFAAAYMAFMWIARVRSFGMAAVLMVVLVVAMRLTLNS